MTALARKAFRLEVIEKDTVRFVQIDEDRVAGLRQECPGLDALTDEELSMLVACFDDRTGDFVGVRFIGPGGVACTFGELDKAAALRVLSERVGAELRGSEYYRMIRAWVRGR